MRWADIPAKKFTASGFIHTSNSAGQLKFGIVNNSDDIIPRIFDGSYHDLTAYILRFFMFRSAKFKQAFIFLFDVIYPQ